MLLNQLDGFYIGLPTIFCFATSFELHSTPFTVVDSISCTLAYLLNYSDHSKTVHTTV